MPSTKFLAVIALATLAVASPVPADSPIPGYEIEELTWEVDVTPGQPPVLARGTVQQVVAEITKRHDPDFEAKVLKRAEEATGVTLAERSNLVLEARQTTGSFCQGRWDDCDLGRIEEGIRYLRGLSGRARIGPGPGKCSRVSCSWDSAIWWCNDNTGEKTLSWNNVADSAQYLINKCGWCYTANNAPVCKVSGQVFHKDNWNGIVRKDRC